MTFKFVTKFLSFNPTDLMNPSLRRRKLLKNPDVMDMVEKAYTFGKNSEIVKLFHPEQVDDFTLENLLEDFRKISSYNLNKIK